MHCFFLIFIFYLFRPRWPPSRMRLATLAPLFYMRFGHTGHLLTCIVFFFSYLGHAGTLCYMRFATLAPFVTCVLPHCSPLCLYSYAPPLGRPCLGRTGPCTPQSPLTPTCITCLLFFFSPLADPPLSPDVPAPARWLPVRRTPGSAASPLLALLPVAVLSARSVRVLFKTSSTTPAIAANCAGEKPASAPAAAELPSPSDILGA